MKTIIVATDFSSAALNAAKYAVEMAQIVEADLLLFNVFEMIPNYNEIVIDITIDDLKRASEKDMQTFTNKLIKLTNTSVKITTQVRIGIFMNEINEVCKNVNPYLLIMGSQGKTAAEKIIFGTHTGKALSNSEFPLITVPNTANFSAIKNIGIAYDFDKEIDIDFIEEMKLLSADFNSQIHILNAAKEDEFDGNFVTLSTKIEKMFSPKKVNFHFITGKDVNDSIINSAEKNLIDLLILMPKHRSLWQKFIGRSHTKQIVLHSHVPVLSLAV